MVRLSKISLHNSSRYRPAAYISIVILIWSLSATVEVLTLRRLSPMQFCACGTAYGSVALLIVIALTKRAKTLLSYSFRDHLAFVLFAVLGYAGYQILKYTAFTMVPVAQANILQYSFPVFIVIFAMPVLKQRLTFSKIAGITMGFTGAAIIISGESLAFTEQTHFAGYFLALCAGASFAMFSVLASRAAYEPVTSMFFIQLYTAIIVSCILLFKGTFAFPSGLPEIAGVFYAGVMAHAAGVMLLIAAQQSVRDISYVSGALYLIPFLSLLGFRVFLDTPIPLYAFTGLVFIVGGMAFHTFWDRRQKVLEKKA